MSRPAELEPLPEDWRRGLVLVAHPDDCDYGAAAAVATWTAASRDLRYVVATRGEAGLAGAPFGVARSVREREQRRAAAVVGVSEVEFLDHADGWLEEGFALRRDLTAAIRRHRPELIITVNHHEVWTPGRWNSADHRVLGRCTLDAATDAGNQRFFPDLANEGLEPWDGVRWVAVTSSPHSTHAVDVTGFVDRAEAALYEHRRFLESHSNLPVKEQARRRIEAVTAPSSRFGGRRAVEFELFTCGPDSWPPEVDRAPIRAGGRWGRRSSRRRRCRASR